MYTAFNLKLDLENFEHTDDLIRIGQNRRKQLQDSTASKLENFFLEDNIVDGTKLSEAWFQTVQSDIFISHSHSDADLAFAFAGWLKSEFDLDVFLDEVIWGSADHLLKIMDKKYSWNPSNSTYNYEKRNFTTSHVHAMLATAIHYVMDKTEAIFFLNTDESFPKLGNILEESSQYTLSPWIYQEVTAAKLLRVTDWSVYRRRPVLEHSQFDCSSTKLNIAYKTPIGELASLDVDTLIAWQKKYSEVKNAPYGGLFLKTPNHPLNCLYDVVFDKED